MADHIKVAWRDFDNDRQSVAYDQLEGSDMETNAPLLKVELDKWTAGGEGGYGFFEQLTVDSGVKATSPIAQRSTQAIVEMLDSVNGRTYITRIPMPNLAKANDAQTPPQPAFSVTDGKTIFNPLHTDYALLVASMTAFASPEGNAVTIQRIYIEE